jgi:short-subunit dehydrogenase
LKETTASLVAGGHEARWVLADVISESDRQRLRAEAGEVDILVNNASRGERKDWLAVSVDKWRAIERALDDYQTCACGFSLTSKA